jgi:hypothetical protein
MVTLEPVAPPHVIEPLSLLVTQYHCPIFNGATMEVAVPLTMIDLFHHSRGDKVWLDPVVVIANPPSSASPPVFPTVPGRRVVGALCANADAETKAIMKIYFFMIR